MSCFPLAALAGPVYLVLGSVCMAVIVAAALRIAHHLLP